MYNYIQILIDDINALQTIISFAFQTVYNFCLKIHSNDQKHILLKQSAYLTMIQVLFKVQIPVY